MKFHSTNKILPSPQALKQALAVWRFHDRRLVFTNGCFDVLHLGHVQYLEQARALGDVLIVGLNADTSVRRLKGAERPLNPQEARAGVLAALWFVDAVVVFDDDTPLELIRQVQPDVLVKGGDYAADAVVGADVVRAGGGRVEILPLTAGYSTTGLAERLRLEK